MKILITGTNGFVGRNLKEYFEKKDYDLNCPKRQQLNLLETESVYEYVKRERPDVVIHCGVTLHSVEENLKMYFNLERCSKFFGKMYLVGSGAEYGRDNYIPRMKEDYFGTHIPMDIYGFSKYVMAKDVESVHRNIYNLRVFGIFGKYEDYMRRFISNNIFRVLCDQDISMNKNMYFDYLYVNDFCRIMEGLLDKEPKSRSYNVCTGDRVGLLDLAEMIKDVDGYNRPINVKQEGLNPEYTGDNSHYLNEFGPFDFTPPKKAVEELYDWYKNSSEIKFDSSSLQ